MAGATSRHAEIITCTSEVKLILLEIPSGIEKLDENP